MSHWNVTVSNDITRNYGARKSLAQKEFNQRAITGGGRIIMGGRHAGWRGVFAAVGKLIEVDILIDRDGSVNVADVINNE